MSENSNSDSIRISIEANEISVAPGSSVVVPVQLTNTSTQAGNYQIFVEGIPASWASTTAQINHLEGGEEKQITLVIQPPTHTETGPGIFPFVIRVVNQDDVNQSDKVEIELTVAAYTVEGRIGIMLESTQFSVASGENTTVQISLHNQGLVDDEFRLSVDGIPLEWISTPSAVTALAAGEQRRVAMTINPPPGSATPAGRYPFTLLVISEQSPEQKASVDCILTVGAMSRFSVLLEPEEIRDGQVGSVVISNNGNIQGSYTVALSSEDDLLDFDPPEEQEVQVDGGDSAAVQYSAKPSRRPWIGSETSYDFGAIVESTDGESQSLQGKLIGEARLPYWIIPLLLILCLAVICISFAVYVVQSGDDGDASDLAPEYQTQTAIAGGIVPTDTLEPGVTPQPTEIPTETPDPTVTPIDTPLPTDTLLPTFTPIPSDTPVPTDTPRVIPNVGRIAYQSNREGDPELYIQNTGTGEIGRLTNSLGVDTHPAYSPDGSRLAFMSNRTGDNEIFIANADGTNPVNITNNPAVDRTPSWSPDGQWIAFATNRDGNLEIYMMRPDGSEAQNLTQNPSDDQAPSWFGGFITFQSNRDGNQEIYLMNQDGSDQRNISNNPADDTTPAGAMNGSRIAFTSTRDGNPEIYVMNSDGANQVNLTNVPSSDQSPAWSRDSNWIAFITDRDGNQEIYMMRDNGSELYNISNHPAEDIVPAWQ